MATTWLKALHRGSGISTALGRSVDYISNSEKTEDGELVYGYECDPYTVRSEFLLSKKLYEQRTGRDQGRRDVIAYHIRMSFKPGEVTAERALELGRELAMRWTKGKHQFIVAAHTNTRNPHVHIIYNSVNLDCTGKYQDFKRSAIALRRVSDQICLEHGLSVIKKPGLPKGYNRKEYLVNQPNMLIDIQAKLQQGYGAGFEHWARIQNLKTSAKTLIFLQERGLDDYGKLVEATRSATQMFNTMSGRVNEIKARQKDIAELQKHIGAYRKTRDVYARYRQAKNKRKFYAENESAIVRHKAAKEYFNELNLKKLPAMKSLQQEYAILEAEKRKLYSGYKSAREEMIALLTAKQTADTLLGKVPQRTKTLDRGAR